MSGHRKQIQFIVTSKNNKMFEGERLKYIIPGYTGHVPHKVQQEMDPYKVKKPGTKIPGYAGYVPGIKPQNLYATTYGTTTMKVADSNFVKGQDIDPKYKYVSTQQEVNIPPSEMLQRTAADIVGVPSKKITVKAPKQLYQSGTQIDQFTLSQTQGFRTKLAQQQNNQNKLTNKHIVQTQDGKQYVKIQKPIPGYTGFGRRVMANNIFGKTFAECMKQSQNDTNKLLHQKNRNFNEQIQHQPLVKF